VSAGLALRPTLCQRYVLHRVSKSLIVDDVT